MLEFNKLSNSAIEKIGTYVFDRIIEKHEGPEHWQSVLKHYDLEFINIADANILLPIDKQHHENITILRNIKAHDGKSIVIFLKDTTYMENPEYEMFSAGFVAICDKVAEEDFFIATMYHEWFIISNQS